MDATQSSPRVSTDNVVGDEVCNNVNEQQQSPDESVRSRPSQSQSPRAAFVDQLSEETLFDSVGHVMNSLNTWIVSNANHTSAVTNIAARASQARNMLEKMAVNKKKHQQATAVADSANTDDVNNMPSKKQFARKRKSNNDAVNEEVVAVSEDVDNVSKDRSFDVTLISSEQPAKKKSKRSSIGAAKKRKPPACDQVVDHVPPSVDDGRDVVDRDDISAVGATSSPIPKKRKRTVARPAAMIPVEKQIDPDNMSDDLKNNDDLVEPKSSPPSIAAPSVASKKRIVKLQRCNDEKVAQFELFDQRSAKKRVPVSLLKLGIRALQPRALLPGESCLISGNVFCDATLMRNVDLAVYGDETNVHVASAGSIVDREVGGLSIYMVNVSPAFHQINVGDVIGYAQFRSLNDSLKLCVQ